MDDQTHARLDELIERQWALQRRWREDVMNPERRREAQDGLRDVMALVNEWDSGDES